MAFKIPTTQQVYDQIIADIEARINQTSPLLAKAFNRVVAASLSLVITGIYKYTAERAAQSLAVTATGNDLKNIGKDRGVIFKPSTRAILSATIAGDDGTVIPVTRSFVAEPTGLRYFPASSQTIVGGTATLELKCDVAGAAGNLSPGNTLNIGAQVAGVESFATVISSSVIGVDEEPQEDYRARVLTSQRATTGGANYADYRTWAELTPGVKRAYPYSGQFGSGATASAPPDRTIFIESTGADGLADIQLLDSVRAMITTDPGTGFKRQPLGLTDSTLYIKSIVRVPFYVSVVGLNVEAGKEVLAKANIESALILYFASVRMFIEGLGYDGDRNDVVSLASIGGIVSDALTPYGGSISTVKFGLSSVMTESQYRMQQGEMAKLFELSYD